MPDGTDGINLPDGANTVVAAPRYAPFQCGVNEWTNKVTDAKLDLAVAARPQGAAIVSTPISGGDTRGLLVDGRMRIVVDQSVATAYDSVGITYAGNRFVRTGISGGMIDVHMMADDLTSSDLLTSVAGNVVAKPAFVGMDGGLAMPVGGDNGISIYRFADSYEPIDSRLVAATSSPVLAVSAAQSGSATLVAWTTKEHCNLMQLNGLESGPQEKLDACPNPRLAVSTASLDGIMVFDSPEGIRMSITRGASVFGRPVVSPADAHSPRALFDGTHFWVSWINERGDVIVGVVNDDNTVRTMGLNFTRPFDSSYELAMLDGSPWVFAVDDSGYSGHRLCVAQQ